MMSVNSRARSRRWYRYTAEYLGVTPSSLLRGRLEDDQEMLVTMKRRGMVRKTSHEEDDDEQLLEGTLISASRIFVQAAARNWL